MLSECFPSKIPIKKVSKHIWRMWDTNFDGFIDFQEFMLALHVMSVGSPEENLRQIFRVFDMDNNGVIDMSEMRIVVKDFSKLELERDDNLQETDVALQAFREMDENVDGKVTLEEFVNACLAQRKCSAMLALKIIDIFIAK